MIEGKAPHPMQPVVMVDGVARFKKNDIVCWLLDNNGRYGMNELATLPFSREDREQFAQLIGYSVSGFGELNYVRTETYEAAALLTTNGTTATDAKIAALEDMLERVRDGLKTAATAVFQIHPDDLQP